MRHGGCRNDDTFRDFDFATPQFFTSTSCRKPLIPFLSHDNHPNTRPYAVPSQLLPRLDQGQPRHPACFYLACGFGGGADGIGNGHVKAMQVAGRCPPSYGRLEYSVPCAFEFVCRGFHVIFSAYTSSRAFSGSTEEQGCSGVLVSGYSNVFVPAP